MRQVRELEPDLLLCAGDLTRDGGLHRFELEVMREDLDSLSVPYRVIGGNTDTGNKHAHTDGLYKPEREPDTRLNVKSEQLERFCEVFGSLHWTVVHRGIRFSGLTDVALGSGLREEGAAWQWLETLVEMPREREHVFLMHYAPFLDDPEEPQPEITDPNQYLDWYFSVDARIRDRLLPILRAAGVTRVISGHIHCRRHVEIEGVRYDHAPSTAFAQCADRWPDGDGSLGLLDYEVRNGDITCSFLPLRAVADDTTGYGPGGHPPPEDRDYALAWER
jgi:hypothetical protein